ncbi:MAG: rubrerythrin, partial [Wenzhouxiangella sp.]
MFDDLHTFLHCAAILEADAANGYDQLATLMKERDNEEVAAMFARFAGYSRRHHQEVEALRLAEAGRPARPDEPVSWPDDHSPENPLAIADLD